MSGRCDYCGAIGLVACEACEMPENAAEEIARLRLEVEGYRRGMLAALELADATPCEMKDRELERLRSTIPPSKRDK